MNRPLAKELEELSKKGIINDETADAIRAYYKSKGGNSLNRLFTVFSILGAILVGLGLILIIAHNWDELSKPTKVFFSFLPLLTGQLFCWFSLTKKSENRGWKEGSTAFLFFAVGACISLISQVYNIHGDLSTFLLTWMLLCFPLIYLMNSTIASLLYIAGITYYAMESHTYWNIFNQPENTYNYWWLLLLALPYYFRLYKNSPDSNAMIFHNWMVPISLTFALSTVSLKHSEVLYVAYASMFGLFYLLGTSDYFQNVRRRVNGYLVIGSLGTMHILLVSSFNWFWNDLHYPYDVATLTFSDPEAIVSIIISALALFVLFRDQKERKLAEFHPMKIIFIIYGILYFAGQSNSTVALILINFIILANGVFTIGSGARNDNLGILNYGLLTITALVVCRFFDSHMSFIIRGLLFVIVGLGFFMANYLMLKKRKANDPGSYLEIKNDQ